MVKAREFCGEERYDSDSSTLEGEIDDSRFILESLSASNLNGSAALRMAKDLPTRQVDRSEKTRAAHDIPTKSAEDAASKSARTNPPAKKRKAKGKDRDKELARTLLELPNAPDFPSNVGEDAASMSAETNPVSKKRKAKAGGRDRDDESVRALLQLSMAPDIPTDVEEDATFMSVGTNKASKKRNAKAFIEQGDNQLMAEETQRPRKGRKRKRHRRDEMLTDVILSSGNEKPKSSTQRNPASRENASDEPSSLQSEVQKMERQDF